MARYYRKRSYGYSRSRSRGRKNLKRGSFASNMYKKGVRRGMHLGKRRKSSGYRRRSSGYRRRY